MRAGERESTFLSVANYLMSSCQSSSIHTLAKGYMSMPLLVMFKRTVILHVGAILRANPYTITMYVSTNLRQHNYTYSLVKHVAAADGLHHC